MAGGVRGFVVRALAAAMLVIAPGAADTPCAAERIGVVLMHGKGGTNKPKSPVVRLGAVLQKHGFMVATPEMPWSRERNLASDYDESMLEIDKAVEALKKQGATRIVVGGHSMGANAAIGYAARREGLAGIIALAPGHVPELKGYQDSMDHDYRRAASMVSAGKGETVGSFRDTDQGRKFRLTATARVYLSWFDPQGPAPIPRNAAAIKPGTPLLWIIGMQDRMFARGPGYAYDRAPSSEKSRYLVVGGGHVQTPVVAAQEVADWLKAL